jgi:hypothetical protein
MSNALAAAMTDLEGFLAPGPMSSKDAFARMDDAGHTRVTTRRALKRLRVVSQRVSTDGAGGGFWVLSLPQDDPPQGAHMQDDQEQESVVTGSQGDHLAALSRAHDAQSEAPQGAQAQDAQDDALQDAQTPPRRKRLIKIRRRGTEATGPDEMSWEEYESIGCDQSRVASFIRQCDAGRNANAEA